MSKQMWVDEEFNKLVNRFGKDLEAELGFKQSHPKITKTIAHILNGQKLEMKNGRRKPKKKKYEIFV